MTLSRTARSLVAAAALVAGSGATVAITAAPAAAAPAVVDARGWNGNCERWVRQQFGASSGFPTAMANWRDAVRKGVAVPGDRTPPKGVLVFWNVAKGMGHVGISVGGGRFRDYRGTFPISSIKNYLGWAPERYS
jgi:hypothetical protein